MYSSDPLFPNDFYLQQEFKIDIDEDEQITIQPPCANTTNCTYSCCHAGEYTASSDSGNQVKFRILEKKRTYRWSFYIFDKSKRSKTLFIESGRNYTLRIWVTKLSFKTEIQSELNGDSNTISDESKRITNSFYSLGEFPVVTFTEFEEYEIIPEFVDSHWEVNFQVRNTFLRSFKIKGHDNSNIFDKISDLTYNFQYKLNIKFGSRIQLNENPQIEGKITCIKTIPCYPNLAILTAENGSAKEFYYTNDSFDSACKLSANGNLTDVYLTIAGLYYIVDSKVYRIDSSGREVKLPIDFSGKGEIIGFFGCESCDFYESFGDHISYENRFVGVYSSRMISYSYNGETFRSNALVNSLNVTFFSVSYRWQCLTILAGDQDDQNQFNPEKPLFIINYDLNNHVASRTDLPFNVTSGRVKYGADYGYFVTGSNLLFSPDSRSMISIFLPGHFQSNPDVTINSIVQAGNEVIVSTNNRTLYCCNIRNYQANQLFDIPSDGYLHVDIQNNVIFVSADSGNLNKGRVMHYSSASIKTYSKLLEGNLNARYLDSGDFVTTNLTIGTVSNRQPSLLIMPPKNVLLRYNVYEQSAPCSTIVTYINLNISSPSSMKSTSEFCHVYYLSMKSMALSSYGLLSRRGEGGDEGSTRIQVYAYSSGKVIDVYNVPLVFGCSPKRRLGIKLHKKICYPDENGNGCIFTVYYNKFFKPIPLIFDNGEYSNDAEFDYALISSVPVKYRLNVRDAGCVKPPQSYQKMGDSWSRTNYDSCFVSSNGENIDGVEDDAYTILNLTSNEIKVTKRSAKYIEFKLINLGSASTLCSFQYSFKVEVIERPLNPGYVVLIVIITIIVFANAIIFEYWQKNQFTFSEMVSIGKKASDGKLESVGKKASDGKLESVGKEASDGKLESVGKEESEGELESLHDSSDDYNKEKKEDMSLQSSPANDQSYTSEHVEHNTVAALNSGHSGNIESLAGAQSATKNDDDAEYEYYWTEEDEEEDYSAKRT